MLTLALLWLGLTLHVEAPRSTCEQCHMRLPAEVAGTHIAEWQASRHAASGVSCVRCHDGNASADNEAEAHRFVRSSRVRTSPTHPTRLPQTCGGCHPRQATEFTTSHHGALLAASAPQAPSCASCHGAMRAEVPAPARLEATCASCHADPARDRYPTDARVLTEWLGEARLRLASAESRIAMLASDAERRRLRDRWERAHASTDLAVGALHAFDLVLARDRLTTTRRELVAIEERLRARLTQ